MEIGLAIFFPAMAVPVFLVPGSNTAYYHAGGELKVRKSWH